MDYICKECNTSFDTENIELKTENRDNGIEQIYYDCPSCEYRYDVCKTSEETRKVQTEIKNKSLLIKRKFTKGTNTVKDVEQLNKLIIKHKKLMNELNGR